MTHPGGSLWEATAAGIADFPALRGEVRARVAIVGGGYTGLSAALHLDGDGAVVIEAEGPGWGASGRNGGQVIAGLKDDPEALIARFGVEAGGRLVQAAGAAPDLVFSLIEQHGIACQAVRAGWVQAATSLRVLPVLRERVRQWQARGVGLRMLDAGEAARLTGSALYCGGLFDPRAGTVQPLAYACGLATAAAGRGVRVFGGSPAVRLGRAGNGWRVETPGGAVSADRVILATNAYSGRLHDGLRRSVVAVPSFQVATARLPPALLGRILPQGQAVSDTRRLLRYVRVFDGRLVVGSRGSYGDPAPAGLLARLRSALAEIYPEAAGLAIDYAWGGMVAMTADHLPHLHELAPGLFAGLGYNGRGVAMATLMGRELARAARGEATDVPFSPLRPLRFHAFSRLGVRAAVEYLKVRDRMDG